jgi:uncharacterized membrane protein YhaH (DUF805 family)
MHQAFNFKRRINRATYFVGIFIGLACLILAVIILSLLISLTTAQPFRLFGVFLIILSGVVYAYYTLCLTKQRANDVSGDNALLFTIIAIFILSVIIGVIPGEKRSNRYGAVPRRGLALK